MHTTKRQLWKTAWWRASLLVVALLAAAWGDTRTTVLAQTSSPQAIEWRGEYYANRDLTGQPALVRTDRGPTPGGTSTVGLNLDWATGAPAQGLPADDFSVRWTAQVPFVAGTYQFRVAVDDGVRLYIDGALVINDWEVGARRERTAVRELSAGEHSLRVEYFERGGVALISVGWERVSGYPNWKGEYWANPTLTGSPVLTRDDADPNGTFGIDFNWENGAPAAELPVDNFSARWTRKMPLDQGIYRFHAAVDDGVRLYVDGALIIDEWRDGARRELTADRWLAAGEHDLRVEYYERSGVASISVWWEKVISYSDWAGEYWPNRNLQGDDKVKRNEPSVTPGGGLDLYWGWNAPVSGIPKDNFSARWTRQVTFEKGVYRFRVTADDGARLYLDGALIMDHWREGPKQEWAIDRELSAGVHTVRLEYFEVAGEALVSLRWDNLSTYPAWKGEYWTNRNLEGTPALVRNDQAPGGAPGIDFNWEMGSPGAEIPVDNFSVRWTRRLYFDAGFYRFTAWVDDGVRVWVGNRQVIDAWSDHELHQVTGEIRLGSGTQTVTVEYYDSVFQAQISVGWEKIAEDKYSEWKGEYYSNPWLSGAPVLVRDDPSLDFDWGKGSPSADLPVDGFSVSWTREIDFSSNVYRFYVHADDGVRVYIDGKRVLDEWHDTVNQTYSFNRQLDGKHELEVRFYENVGDARIHFWWTRVSDLPVPQ